MTSILPHEPEGKATPSDAEIYTAMVALGYGSWSYGLMAAGPRCDVDCVAQALADQRAKHEALLERVRELAPSAVKAAEHEAASA